MYDQLTNYEGNWHVRAYCKWYSVRPGVVGLKQMLKLLMNLLIFLMVNTFSVVITGLKLRLGYYSFLHHIEIIYTAIFSGEELNIDSLCVSFQYLSFL